MESELKTDVLSILSAYIAAGLLYNFDDLIVIVNNNNFFPPAREIAND